MASTDLLREKYLRFLSGEELVGRGRLEHGLDEILGEVKSLLSVRPEQLMRARRLSFGSADAVTYPDSIADVESGLETRTLILQGLELSEGPAGGLCQELSSATSRPVGASCYISLESSDAFDWHVDLWDSLVLQLDGSKCFELRGHDDAELIKGDFLMFRKGVEHRTRTIGHSAHVSFSVRDA